MAIAPGSLGFEQLATDPPAPPVGFCIIYSKTDNVVYLRDSSGVIVPLGSASSITSLTGEATGSGPGAAVVTLSNSAVIGKVLTGFTSGPNSIVLATDSILQAIQKLQAQVTAGAGITALTGDVTATGPGSVPATVAFVGGKTAAQVATSVNDTLAATPTNTASTIVKRDASGNFSANLITADLIGNADTATTAIDFTGILIGDVTGTQGATVVSTVGGKTASAVAQSVTDTQAATAANTASTIVKRDASGNFSANIITANLTGVASGNEPTITAGTVSDYWRGDKTFQPLNKAAVGLSNVDNTSDVNKPVSTAQAAADAAVQAFAIQRANHTGTQLSTTISDFNEAAQDAIGGILIDSATIDFTYDDAGNTITAIVKPGSITGTELATGIDASYIGAGTVSNTEFGYLDGVTSPIQTQINSITGSGITSLTGDVTGTGPGATATTVAFVGTSSAANIHSAELAANAATNLNTASTIVKRDASGNFIAGTITANLTGAASANVLKSGDTMTGELFITAAGTGLNVSNDVLIGGTLTVTGTIGGSNLSGTNTGDVTVLDTNSIDLTVLGQLLSADLLLSSDTADSGFYKAASSIHSGVNKGLLVEIEIATGSQTGVISSTDWTTFNNKQPAGNYITALTGDVTASGPGSVGATVAFVGTSSAANIHSAELAANAATATNTPSTIVKRDSSGNFAAGTITAALTGAASANVLKAGDTMTGELFITAAGTGLNVSNDVLIGGTLGVTGTITGGNLSGTNSGDVTITDTDSIDLTLAGQNITAALKLSSDAADTGNIKATVSIHSGAGAGLHVELPFDVPVQVGTSNFIGASSKFALSDHVHSHGNQTSGTLHAVVTSLVNGFMSTTDKVKLDASTAVNTPSTLVFRDSSGNFAAGTITANLTGNVSGSASSFTGVLIGDVTGTQGATVVSTVGGKTATQVATSVNDTIAATNLNTASTIVKRDGSGGVIFGNAEIVNYLTLDQATAPGSAPANKVRIYDEVSNGFDRTRWIDSTGLIVTWNRDNYNVTYNNSGSTINKGQAVYISGNNAGAPTIALARADAVGTAQFYGIAMESIASGAFGRIQFTGVISNVDTSAYSAGQVIYLSSTVAGSFTNTVPLAPNLKVLCGIVTVSAVSGIIVITPQAVINNSSGTSLNTFKIGDGIAGAKSLTFNAAGLGTLQWTPTTSRTLTLPDFTGQVATAQMSTAFIDAVVALTDAATIATDASLGNIFTVTLGGNRTLGNPTNPVNGQKVTWRIRQDATGSRTLAFDTAFNFPPSIAGLSLSTSPNTFDYIGAQYNSVNSKWDVLAFTPGLS